MLLTTLCYTMLLCHSLSNTFYVGILFPILSTVFVGTSRSSLLFSALAMKSLVCISFVMLGFQWVITMWRHVSFSSRKISFIIISTFLIAIWQFSFPHLSCYYLATSIMQMLEFPNWSFIFFISLFSYFFFPIFKLFCFTLFCYLYLLMFWTSFNLLPYS